ncbi:hypothetical protein SAMN05446037_100637 [Anaerovirgula multivorans]|uniref:Uncharacterized protein n=1 Tax=Anaerovirgula multivorans TaxID=312168 RepID=A0A239CLA0_9FIRM|nr:hypothetical protein [Anaerovirgula multivorans]SNS21026.1 hypothetical protein SAMN05446037_100637 [Anaerovirgula multivorans]
MDRRQIEGELNEYTNSRVIISKVQKAGLPIPPKPVELAEGVNIFTEWEKVKKQHGGMANIPFHILGDFLDRWTSVLAYARWCEAITDIDQASAREIRDTVKQQLYTLQDGGREIRSAEVCTEPIYREWEKKYTESLTLMLATKALREGYEQRVFALSRELTRRGNDVIDIRRGDNGKTIGRYGHD